MDQTRFKRDPEDYRQKPVRRKRLRFGKWVLLVGLLAALGAFGTCSALPNRSGPWGSPGGLLASTMFCTFLVGLAFVVVGFIWWMIDLWRK